MGGMGRRQLKKRGRTEDAVLPRRPRTRRGALRTDGLCHTAVTAALRETLIRDRDSGDSLEAGPDLLCQRVARRAREAAGRGRGRETGLSCAGAPGERQRDASAGATRLQSNPAVGTEQD